MDEVDHNKPHLGSGCQVPDEISLGCKKRTSREDLPAGLLHRLNYAVAGLEPCARQIVWLPPLFCICKTYVNTDIYLVIYPLVFYGVSNQAS